ncbi:MAG: hypothetical protein RLZZ271_1183 [Pseudomonadota bacterium]|jgi:dephospho-CoA kinase
MPVLHLGLTGGIGSGKSTVASDLGKLGAGVVDADAISRQTTAPHGFAIEAIREAFGSEFITPEGALDRPRMSSLCFSLPDMRQKLESIIHPIVQQELARQASEHEERGKRIIVWDIPLLVESAHWRPRLNRILVIDCSRATQIRRVLARSQALGQPRSETEIARIIDSQASREQRRTCADWVIFNEDLGIDALQAEVQQVYSQAMGCLEPVHSGLSFGL